MAADGKLSSSKVRKDLFYTTVHERNINSVKLLIDTVLPVRYSNDFYNELIRSPPDFTKMGSCTHVREF